MMLRQILSITLTIGPLLVVSPALSADLIFHNGKVLTVDDQFSVAEAIAIRDGKVLAVGSNTDVLRHAIGQTRRVDLKGKTVVPGLIDTHAHLFEYAIVDFAEELERMEPRMRQFRPVRVDATSMQDALSKIGERAKQTQVGQWVRLRIYPATVAAEIWQKLKITELDQLAPNNPLVLRLAGTQHYLNSVAFEAVRKHYGELPGDLEMDAQARPTGRARIAFVRMIAQDLLATPKVLAPVYKKEMEQWASYRITTWSSSIMPINPLSAYVQLDRRGEMPIRFAYSHAMGNTGFLQAAGFYQRMGDLAGHGTPYLWNIGASTEAIDGAYPSGCTTINARPEVKDLEICRAPAGSFMRKVLHAMVSAGLRLSGVHTQGDGAADHFLDVVEEASREAGMSFDDIRAKRHAIDHCSLNPRPDQIERAKRLGIIWSCGPRFFMNGDQVSKDYGEKYAHQWAVPVGSILEAGGKVVIETDDGNLGQRGAFWHIEKLVTRKDEKGKVWGKEEAVDRRTALRMFTRWAAEYVLREDVLGSLEPGKWADLVVIDRDFLSIPNEDINLIKVLLTVVGGKLVHTEAGFAQAEGLPQVGYRSN
jgi:predicted amidohydrolase YtcJ